MIARISYFLLNLQAASSIAFVALCFLTAAGHASAQSFVDPLQNCRVRKAYAVTAKVLAVYASHILTIKVEPGLGLRDTIRQYLAAALLPSSSAQTPITDFMFLWKRPRSSKANKICHNMQKAINCGAVCVRVKRAESPPDARVVPPSFTVTGKPLEDDEEFVIVPRGTHADLFVPTMIKSRGVTVKALLGGAQIYFATLQLVSAADPQVAAYGYGAFIYTIIPYALGSFINLISLISTGDYIDLTEMEIQADTIQTDDTMEIQDDTLQRKSNDIMEIEAAPINWRSSDIKGDVMFMTGLLQFAIYLAVVGGVTRFRPGISSSAQRGWFMSWALCGTLYGYLARPMPAGPTKRSVAALLTAIRMVKNMMRQSMPSRPRGRRAVAERPGNTLARAERADSTMPVGEKHTDSLATVERAESTMSKAESNVMVRMAENIGERYVEIVERPNGGALPFIMIGIGGAATVGGMVTMVQQYMSIIHC